ncbi:MAG TPA: glycogen debranching N-terminal domain-containing protein, partial [Pilimelia sp.]|nr:glycogen debranching N-terminal domain-containing protein [Pilimelia sp.]
MTGDATVAILDGNTFVVSDQRGDINATPTDTTGLFSSDTRFLSTWSLTVDGQRLNPLSVDDLEYYATRFFLVPGTGTVYVDATLSVIRQRAVAEGFHEEVRVLNHSGEPVELTVRLDAAADFADLFEVKNATAKKGKHYTLVDQRELLLGYARESFVRETLITADRDVAIDDSGFTFTARLAPHGEWRTELRVTPLTGTPADSTGAGAGGAARRPRRGGAAARRGHDAAQAEARMARNLGGWLAKAPSLECDNDDWRVTYRRSLVDLAALRFSPPVTGNYSLPAAGLPWFMAIFGRDSILTSLQALPFAPELARTTLRALGDWQGATVDDFRDEDPGRILHEMRYGESAAFEEQPHSPYYGTADATPLYVVLLDEYEQWTGDLALVRQLEPEARAALDWIDRYADLRGTGYIYYQRRNTET